MKKHLIQLFSILLLFAISCNSGNEKKEEEVQFLVTKPLEMDTSITREYVCQIKAISHIEIRSLEKGYLEKIYVDEGMKVKKGHKMFQIMPVMYQAELQKAQAEAEFAEIEYLNTKQLADKNVVSPNELALAKAKLDKANGELAVAKAHLNFTQIVAPFEGIMDKFNVRLGSLLDEGDLLTTLSDNSKMWVYFNVPESEYLDYKTQKKSSNIMVVELEMANGKIFPFKGKVETIEADFNNETGNIAFRATFDNPEGLLRHGETGNILMNSKLDNAIIIPQKATFEILEKKYVFVVDKNKIIHQREIEIAAEIPDLYVLKSGLKPEEQILFEGIRKVRDKDKLGNFKYEAPESVFSKLKVYVE